MNEIERVMALSPEELMGRPQDIDALIDYLRQTRVAYQSGVKPKKNVVSQPIDLVALGLVKAATPVKRRKV